MLYEVITETGKYKTISADVTEFSDSTILEFNYQLNPVVKTIDAIGIKLLDKNVVDSILSVLINKPFNNRIIAKAISKILRHYRLEGYLLADFERLDFDKQKGSLVLFFNEGLISNIKVVGNYTRETLITREVKLKTGDYFVYDKAKESLDNLTSSGFFKDIAMYIDDRITSYNVCYTKLLRFTQIQALMICGLNSEPFVPIW